MVPTVGLSDVRGQTKSTPPRARRVEGLSGRCCFFQGRDQRGTWSASAHDTGRSVGVCRNGVLVSMVAGGMCYRANSWNSREGRSRGEITGWLIMDGSLARAPSLFSLIAPVGTGVARSQQSNLRVRSQSTPRRATRTRGPCGRGGDERKESTSEKRGDKHRNIPRHETLPFDKRAIPRTLQDGGSRIDDAVGAEEGTTQSALCSRTWQVPNLNQARDIRNKASGVPPLRFKRNRHGNTNRVTCHAVSGEVTIPLALGAGPPTMQSGNNPCRSLTALD